MSLREITGPVVLELFISFINTFMISKFHQFLEVNRFKSDTSNVEILLIKAFVIYSIHQNCFKRSSLLHGLSPTCGGFG